MSEESEILFEERGPLGVVTLNRPQALNALTRTLCVRMTAQLRAWARRPDIAAVAIRGAGDRAFSAGGDIRALYDSGQVTAGPRRYEAARQFYWDEYRLDALVFHYPKPYIALVDGIVMGGGVGVSLHGSHRLMTERASFAMPETGIGLFPDVGGSYFLPRCPFRIGVYLALTGARTGAADCLFAGLADMAISSMELERILDALEAADYGARPHAAVDDALSPFRTDPGQPGLAPIADDIERLFAGTRVEDILAALGEAGTDWGSDTAAAIATKSPTSLKVTLEALARGHARGFDDCMRMEYRLARRFIEGHDFYEGVRAAVIDKDRSPRWQPDRLEAVTAEAVAAYFALLGDRELALDDIAGVAGAD